MKIISALLISGAFLTANVFAQAVIEWLSTKFSLATIIIGSLIFTTVLAMSGILTWNKVKGVFG